MIKTSSNKRLQRRSIVVLALVVCCVSTLLVGSKQVLADVGSPPSTANQEQEVSKRLPANHRMDANNNEANEATSTTKTSRQSRQYDGPMSTSGTGSYAALASDLGAYVGGGGGAQMPPTGASYSASTGAGSAYMGELSSAMGAYPSGGGGGGGAYHLDHMARGYPAMHSAGYPAPPPPPMGPLSAMFGSSSSSSMFPLMAKGFDVSEIICTAIAVAIGAVIVGAPFILLYLFVMNQMGGNGPMMGPNGGSISLTGPTSSTNVSGRKKRHTSFSEALFRQLSPFVNSEQLTSTFKMLIDSLAKYQ